MNDNLDTKKVVDIVELSEEEISKIGSIKIVIKGLLSALYDKKFSNFMLSSLFFYMVYAGIIEEFYVVSIIYGIGFLRYTNFKSAYEYIKDVFKCYKIKKENINEDDLIIGEQVFESLKNDEKISSLNNQK